MRAGPLVLTPAGRPAWTQGSGTQAGDALLLRSPWPGPLDTRSCGGRPGRRILAAVPEGWGRGQGGSGGGDWAWRGGAGGGAGA